MKAVDSRTHAEPAKMAKHPSGKDASRIQNAQVDHPKTRMPPISISVEDANLLAKVIFHRVWPPWTKKSACSRAFAEPQPRGPLPQSFTNPKIAMLFRAIAVTFRMTTPADLLT